MFLQERKHYENALPLEQNLAVRYSLESPLGKIDNNRYRQSIIGSIVLMDDADKSETEIGRLCIDHLLFGTGMNNGWNHFEIFDTEQYLMNLGNVIWDFEADDFNKALNQFFSYDLTEMDVLYMHSIEVLPEHRGMQIGEHVMKDAANNFEAGCGLIVTDCLPLQHTGWRVGDKVWRKKMRYDLFEKGKRKAKQRVIQYLKRTGFYYLPKVSKEYMFLCPAQRNPNFDYIELK